MTDPEPGLTRYWFEFTYLTGSPGWFRGPVAAGVTACDLEDARCLLSTMFFDPLGIEFPEVAALIQDVDVSAIKFPHTTPNGINYLPPIWRGVWFPAQSSLPARGDG